MIITITIEQYAVTNNGTTVTARRFAQTMRERGHTVRVITVTPCENEPDIYVIPRLNVPIFTKLVRVSGMDVPKQDEECYRIIGEAVFGADIVHCFLPFGISHIAVSYAKMYGIPYMGAFHCQPENITYTLHLNKMERVNEFLYRHFRKFYDTLPHLHCPSEMIKEQLEMRSYKSKLHVISNGINEFFSPEPTERPAEYRDKFVVVMSGRYSREKRQDLLIKAIASSKYKDKIVLHLCGRGPWEKKLRKLTKKYLDENQVVFGFRPQTELKKLYNYADLYVHASDIEIEAISCMEAFACGLVPIISDNPLVATKKFARDEDCLFKSGDYENLAAKIDNMLTDSDKRNKLKSVYAEYAGQYILEECVDRLTEVMQLCIKEFREKMTTAAGSTVQAQSLGAASATVQAQSLGGADDSTLIGKGNAK